MARSPRNSNAPTASAPPAPSTRTRNRPPIAPAPPPVVDNAPSPQTKIVEAKTHGLRSVLGEKERAPCPFPGEYGGREKLGVTEEDERDEVLMAVCAACAKLDNRALSAEEIAAIAIEEGWLRPPSAAVVPSTIINNAIRAHQKRAATASPARPCLLNKHQLAGSVNESVLEPALHPTAFNGLARPKGSFWYLAQIGKVKWKNPFAGIEIPKALPRKPGPPKRTVEKAKAKIQPKPKARTPTATASTIVAAPPKVRLIIRPQQADEEASEGESSNPPSRMSSVAPAPTRPMRTVYSSDESDASDSEPEAGPSRMLPIRIKNRPPPLPLTSSRITIPPHVSRSLGSPFLDWLPDSPNPSGLCPPASSPFPSHSLDNTTWGVRHDRFASFETSSSSSDDDMRDSVDWGTASGIMIRSVDEDDVKPVWSTEDEDSKVKEATDALRVLFPMSTTEDQLDERVHLNQLDNRLSDTSSIAESTTTVYPLKSADVSSLALAWNITSSPIASPKCSYPSLPETSPTQHLSKLKNSFESSDSMEIDEVWQGELPVRADDNSSDVELDPDMVSNIGDVLTPEDDRQLHTAAWAREAAVSSFRVKEEIADYPSPMTTESDNVSHVDRTSRASSQESHTPSSGLSDLPFELETITRDDIETILDGPESVTIDELDQCFVGKGRPDKTPQRNRNKAKPGTKVDVRYSAPWGGIGVGTCMSPVKITPARRGRLIRRRSSARTPVSTRTTVDTLPTPPADTEADMVDLDFDAIGPADLDAACAEAEAREERHRKACREKAEKQKAFLEAYREKVKEAQLAGHTNDVSPPTGKEFLSPWSDGWTDHTPSALSPMALHMSALSLESSYQSMDPKTLLSPVKDITPIPPVPSKPAEKPVPIAIKKETPRPVPVAARPPPPPLKPIAEVKKATPTTSGASTPTSATVKSRSTTTKNLAPGVDACVIDAIPVYAHVQDNKHGKFTLIRRLDTDFVNATMLLTAFGVSATSHEEYLDGYPTTEVDEICNQSNKHYTAGVPGLWISYNSAVELVAKLNLKPEDKGYFDNFMREDLFKTFASLAGINGRHITSAHFGSPFRAAYERVIPASASAPASTAVTPGPASAPSSAPSSAPGSASVSTARAPAPAHALSPKPPLAPSVNSKSAPDLPSLSTTVTPSAAPRPIAPAGVKGPLIRPVPATPLEAAPQPKRRRATMSLAGEISPLAKITPTPVIPIAPAGGKKAPVRATRASIAGDTLKPRVVK